MTVSGVVVTGSTGSVGGERAYLFAVVPNGGTYIVAASSGTGSIPTNGWNELR
jgi:hypothetical protein